MTEQNNFVQVFYDGDHWVAKVVSKKGGESQDLSELGKRFDSHQ